jgi:hypothetical protein
MQPTAMFYQYRTILALENLRRELGDWDFLPYKTKTH